METNATTTDAPPKAFHLDLDTVPTVVRRHVDGLIQKIETTIRSAEVITWIDEVMAALGIHSTGTIPSSLGEGAWCTIMVKDGQQLSSLRRRLVDAGWHLKERSDYPEDRRFVLPHQRGEQTLSLNCYLGGQGSRCQYVKVGEKSVPIMQLQCDGDEAQS